MDTNIQKFNQIFSRTLHVSKGEIHDTTAPETVPAWDSFNALMLISELEKEFNTRFTMDQVTSAKNVGDLKEALRKNGVSL